MQESLYCKIFVAGPSSRDQLLVAAAVGLGGARSGTRTVEHRVAVVDANVNDDVEPSSVGADEAFLAYPLTLDVEPAEGAERAEYVTAVGSLLTHLWSSGWSAVAACDFEAELPYNGGYSNGQLTFPIA